MFAEAKSNNVSKSKAVFSQASLMPAIPLALSIESNEGSHYAGRMP